MRLLEQNLAKSAARRRVMPKILPCAAGHRFSWPVGMSAKPARTEPDEKCSVRTYACRVDTGVDTRSVLSRAGHSSDQFFEPGEARLSFADKPGCNPPTQNGQTNPGINNFNSVNWLNVYVFRRMFAFFPL